MKNSLKIYCENNGKEYLLHEWDEIKNNLKSSEVSFGSSRIKYWWNCEILKHSFQASNSNRIKGRDCPYCAGRKFASDVNSVSKAFPEKLKYWSHKNLESPENSHRKDTHKWFCKICKNSWESKPTKTMGCPYCAGKRVLPGFNDLETLRPNIASQWSENNPDSPSDYTIASHKKALWNCKENHEWTAQIGSRVKFGYGCPICAGQVIITGVNDFVTKNSDRMAEWDTTLNRSRINPNTLKSTSRELAWWSCSEGHKWETSYASINKGSKCTYCAGKKVISGKNDLKSKRPEIIKYWHKSNNIDPTKVFNRSSKSIFWNCAECKIIFSESPSKIGVIPLCKECFKTQSAVEASVFDYLKSVIGEEILVNDRILLKGSEIDFYIPELKIGIEVNGDYWHSNAVILKNCNETAYKRHLRKFTKAQESGVTLAFVWENDWNKNNKLVKDSLILLIMKNELSPILKKLEGK